MKKINSLNIIALNIIIAAITSFNCFFGDLISTNFGTALVVSILAAIFSYQVLTELLYKLIEKNDFLFKVYWGKLYLKGIWYYEYTVQGEGNKTYYGIWKIDQDLNNIKIIGYGYNDELTEIRTRLCSVTELIQNNSYYDIIHIKNEVSNPNIEFYAKSSISFLDTNRSYPKKFHSITYIYGGNHSGETHLDTFYKIENVDSEDVAINIIKNRGKKMLFENEKYIKKDKIVILVMGRTASGKTTTAKHLADILDYEYIPCAYYKRLVKAEYKKTDSLNDELRDEGLKLAVNAAVEAIKHKSVVLDSSFGSSERRKYVINCMAKYADAIYVIYCKSTNIEETRNRIESRKGREDEDLQFHASDFKVFEHIDQTFEEPSLAELENVKGNKYIFYVDTFNKSILPIKNMHDEITTHLFKVLKEEVIR